MGQIRLGNKPLVTVVPDDTVLQAARAMTERNVGAATVLDGTKVVGVVTERDMMQKIVAAHHDPNTMRVREIMSSPAMSIGLDTSVATAAAVMREHHIRIWSSSTNAEQRSACWHSATCYTIFWTTWSATLATSLAIS